MILAFLSRDIEKCISVFCILCFLIKFSILLNELKGKKGFFWTIVGTYDDHDSWVLFCLLSWHFVFRGIFHVCIISTKKQVFFALFFSFTVQEKIAQSLVKKNKTLLKEEALKLKRKLRGEIKKKLSGSVKKRWWWVSLQRLKKVGSVGKRPGTFFINYDFCEFFDEKRNLSRYVCLILFSFHWWSRNLAALHGQSKERLFRITIRYITNNKLEAWTKMWTLKLYWTWKNCSWFNVFVKMLGWIKSSVLAETANKGIFYLFNSTKSLDIYSLLVV